MVDLSSLNEAQRAVVMETENCLAVSCPGSGKTTTLAKKIAYLLEQGKKVAAVTFTREAALELRARAAALAPASTYENLIVGTFHSICLSMIAPKRLGKKFSRRILEAMVSPFHEAPKIAYGGDLNAYILAAMRESGTSLSLKDATKLIEEYKGRQTAAADDAMQALVACYQKQLNQAGSIDFQDILLKTNAALKDGSMTPLPVDCLLIDEFQDTDATQYQWIRYHGNNQVKLTAVGDDDQSIYAFRRALGYDVMENFIRDFQAKKILLGQNYRCHSEILDRAGNLIANNTRRIAKALVAAKGPGGDVYFQRFDSVEEEAEEVVDAGRRALRDKASFTVIARTHRELLEIQRVCIVEDVPFKANKGDSIFDRFEVVTFGALTRFLLQPTAQDLDHIMNWAQMSIVDRAQVRRSFKRDKQGRLDVLAMVPEMTEGGKALWRTFVKRYLGWCEAVAAKSHFILMDGIREWLEASAPRNTSKEVIRIAHDIFSPNEHDLAAHLAYLQEKMSRFAKEKDDGREAINLITAHAAKGLEYDRVWIIGLVEGGFPSEKSPIEEERRLMYVAMTRAKDVLNVSSTADKKTSPFVYEAALVDDVAKPKEGERGFW